MRASTAALIVGIGAPMSKAFWLIHLPVPFCCASSRIVSTSGLPLLVGPLEDARGDLDQVGPQLAVVPLREDVGELARGQTRGAVQDVVDLGDELHVAVFDAVVHHLHVVPGTSRSHVLDARLAVLGLGGDGAEDRRQRVPRLLRSARHDRRAEQRAFLAAGDAGADEAEAGGGEVVAAPIGVGEERIAAVDEDVAFVQVRTQVRDDAVDRLTAGTIISTRRGCSSISISCSGLSAPAMALPFAGPSRKPCIFFLSRS